MQKGKKRSARKGNIPLFLAAFGLVFLLLMGIFGEWGLVDLLKLRKEKAGITAVNAEIAAENEALARRIYRLKNDREYVENIIRRELGVVKEGELIIKMKPVGRRIDNDRPAESEK